MQKQEQIHDRIRHAPFESFDLFPLKEMTAQDVGECLDRYQHNYQAGIDYEDVVKAMTGAGKLVDTAANKSF